MSLRQTLAKYCYERHRFNTRPGESTYLTVHSAESVKKLAVSMQWATAVEDGGRFPLCCIRHDGWRPCMYVCMCIATDINELLN